MSVAVTVTTMERVNLEEHKARLTSTLKDNWVTYWDLLKRYVQSKLSKQELDTQARVLLGDENVSLHNQFFLALLQNVHAAIIPKIIISRKDSGLGKDKSKKFLKRGKDGSGIQKKRKPLLGPGLRPPDSAPNLRRFRDSHGLLRPIVVRPKPTVAPPQFDFVLGTPELAALRGRMMKIAAEAGLADVHNDSVHLLMNALEQHLKDLVGVCEASQPSTTTGERIVTLRELLVAAQTSPYLLGEDRPLNMERLVAAEYRIPPRPLLAATRPAPVPSVARK